MILIFHHAPPANAAGRFLSPLRRSNSQRNAARPNRNGRFPHQLKRRKCFSIRLISSPCPEAGRLPFPDNQSKKPLSKQPPYRATRPAKPAEKLNARSPAGYAPRHLRRRILPGPGGKKPEIPSNLNDRSLQPGRAMERSFLPERPVRCLSCRWASAPSAPGAIYP